MFAYFHSVSFVLFTILLCWLSTRTTRIRTDALWYLSILSYLLHQCSLRNSNQYDKTVSRISSSVQWVKIIYCTTGISTTDSLERTKLCLLVPSPPGAGPPPFDLLHQAIRLIIVITIRVNRVVVDATLLTRLALLILDIDDGQPAVVPPVDEDVHLFLVIIVVVVLLVQRLLLSLSLLVQLVAGDGESLHYFEDAEDGHTQEEAQGASKVRNEQGHVVAPLFSQSLWQMRKTKCL